MHHPTPRARPSSLVYSVRESAHEVQGVIAVHAGRRGIDWWARYGEQSVRGRLLRVACVGRVATRGRRDWMEVGAERARAARGSIMRRSASPRFARAHFARTRDLPLPIFCLFARAHNALAPGSYTPGSSTSTAYVASTRTGWSFLAKSSRARFLALSTMQQPAS